MWTYCCSRKLLSAISVSIASCTWALTLLKMVPPERRAGMLPLLSKNIYSKTHLPHPTLPYHRSLLSLLPHSHDHSDLMMYTVGSYHSIIFTRVIGVLDSIQGDLCIYVVSPGCVSLWALPTLRLAECQPLSALLCFSLGVFSLR